MALSMLSGCMLFSSVKATNTRTTSIARELIDLKAAYDKDIITSDEYQASKAKLLAEYDSIDIKIEACDKD